MMSTMLIMLATMLGIGAVLVRVVPPPHPPRAGEVQRKEAQAILRASTTAAERSRYALLSRRLGPPPDRQRSEALAELASWVSGGSVLARSIRTSSHGARDLCVIDFEDGRLLRLTVFDHRNARRFASAWSENQALEVRCRWIEGVGWQCLLVDPNAAAVASVYGWIAELETLSS